ncbi:MAG: hypothetical protein ACJAT2_000217 [Bacteriovoracaceae bacterium]|jgi:uncharacterized protein (TIGR00730 family)
MNSLCVFCGSKEGKSKKYTELGLELGALMAKEKMPLVYGGGSVGIMGVLADACLENGGSVYGVMPQSLMDWEVGHSGLTELTVVESMHERKAKMYELSDGFVALPGGMGTLDELCEIITWAQLDYHKKPIYLLNDFGFFDHLIKHFDLAVEEGFLSQEHRDWVNVVEGPKNLIEAFKNRG